MAFDKFGMSNDDNDEHVLIKGNMGSYTLTDSVADVEAIFYLVESCKVLDDGWFHFIYTSRSKILLSSSFFFVFYILTVCCVS